MSDDLVFRRKFHIERVTQGRKLFQTDSTPGPVQPVPPITRLMALAIQLDLLLRDGEVASQAELARLGHVTRARLTQIMAQYAQVAMETMGRKFFSKRPEA